MVSTDDERSKQRRSASGGLTELERARILRELHELASETDGIRVQISRLTQVVQPAARPSSRPPQDEPSSPEAPQPERRSWT